MPSAALIGKLQCGRHSSIRFHYLWWEKWQRKNVPFFILVIQLTTMPLIIVNSSLKTIVTANAETHLHLRSAHPVQLGVVVAGTTMPGCSLSQRPSLRQKGYSKE